MIAGVTRPDTCNAGDAICYWYTRNRDRVGKLSRTSSEYFIAIFVPEAAGVFGMFWTWVAIWIARLAKGIVYDQKTDCAFLPMSAQGF
jgi:hypothetical protein